MEKRRRLTPAERRAVYDKMGGRYAYCGEQLNYEDMQVDHVVALRSEGEDDLQICCRPVGAVITTSAATHWRAGGEYWKLCRLPWSVTAILTVRLYGLVWLSQRQRKLRSTLKGGASE